MTNKSGGADCIKQASVTMKKTSLLTDCTNKLAVFFEIQEALRLSIALF
jgi:hypothetical protein